MLCRFVLPSAVPCDMLSLVVLTVLVQFKLLHTPQCLFIVLHFCKALHIVPWVGKGCRTIPTPQRRVISPVRIVRNRHAQHTPDRHIIHVVSVVFTAGYSNQRRAEKWSESKKDACEVGAGSVDVALSRDEQGQIPQTREAEAAMSTWETTPAIMQYVVVLLGADFECDKLVRGRTWRRLASRNEVGPRASDGVLDDVGDEEREDHANEPAEDRDVCFVRAWAHEKGPEDEGAEGYGAGVDEEPCWERYQPCIYADV